MCFQTIPAVRGQKQSSVGKKDVDAKEDTSKKSAASHTYDYFKDKWDKFDVVTICPSGCFSHQIF